MNSTGRPDVPGSSLSNHPLHRFSPRTLAIGFYLMLVLAVPLLVVASDIVVNRFPVSLQIAASDTVLVVRVDGETHIVPLSSPLRSLRFPEAEPYQREYQIDGSDSTNNFTLDLAYFARIAETPYYRLQAWLRDESSYSQWRDLVVRDGSGQILVQQSEPVSSVPIPLNHNFALTVNLSRPEIPRAVEIVGESGVVTRVELNRNDKYVYVTDTFAGWPSRQLDSWYFPSEWTPYAAELFYMALRVAALILAIIVVLVPLAALIPVWFSVGRRNLPFLARKEEVANSIDRASKRPRSIGNFVFRLAFVVPLLAALFTIAAGLYVGIALFDRVPHILDAVSYYFQGKIIANGMLAAPAPSVDQAFQMPFMIMYRGEWFSQYPPGTPLALAVGFLVGMPWAIEPILAGGAVLLVFAIARRKSGVIAALLTVVLMASSPFLILQSGSFMSHVPAMFGAVVFLYGVVRYLEAPSRLWVVVAAVGLSYAFLCREVSAALFGLPIGIYVIRYALVRYRRRVWPDLMLAAGIGVLFLGGYLVYNWGLTGSPLVLPRNLFFSGDFFGFGPGIGFYGQNSPAAGLANTDELLTSLNISLFGWPFYFTLAFIAAPFLLRRATTWDKLIGIVFGLYVVVYFTYFYHGIALGPRYYFEALPLLAMLAARGFVVITQVVADLLGRLGRSYPQPRATVAVACLGLALMLCNVLYYLPRQADLYHGYSGLPVGGNPRLDSFITTDRLGRVATLDNAVVVVDDWWLYVTHFAALNTPRLDGSTVFALATDLETWQQLRAVYPDRTFYRVELQDDRCIAIPY